MVRICVSRHVFVDLPITDIDHRGAAKVYISLKGLFTGSSKIRKSET